MCKVLLLSDDCIKYMRYECLHAQGHVRYCAICCEVEKRFEIFVNFPYLVLPVTPGGNNCEDEIFSHNNIARANQRPFGGKNLIPTSFWFEVLKKKVLPCQSKSGTR